MSDDQIIKMILESFRQSEQYHKSSSYALKHVLQQKDGDYYLTESEFIRLLIKAGIEISPTTGLKVKVKVWVIPNDKVRRELWGFGKDKKLMSLK